MNLTNFWNITSVFILLASLFVLIGWQFQIYVPLNQGYPIESVPLTQVEVAENSFWGQKIVVNRSSTIPYTVEQLYKTGRLKNFEMATAGSGTFLTRSPWDDIDVYKMIEAVSYVMTRDYDKQLDHQVDSLIYQIAAAQQEDGYVYTYENLQSNEKVRENHKEFYYGKERWQKVDEYSHELYNAGHLIEAAVAHKKATGKDNLLNVAIKFADLITETFGPGENQLKKISGHQEIELALVRLYELTGEEKYLNTADFFLQSRGRYTIVDEIHPDRSDVHRQNHKPVMQQSKAVGHNVRGTYMYSAMADVGVWKNDGEYVSALDRIWNDLVSKKLYITGGIGGSRLEEFGSSYDLPNSTSYNHTRAAIAYVLWNHRMFKLKGDASYYDVLERTLYNNVISGVSLDGEEFFYENRLESEGGIQRQRGFNCSGCPPDIARFIASMPEYIYAHNQDTAYINLFVENTASIELANMSLDVSQQTRYPWDGNVHMNVNPEKEATFTIKIRIPSWARNMPVSSNLYHYHKQDSTLKMMVNGKSQPLNLHKGYIVLTRSWSPGDIIELQLPMKIRTVAAHDSVKADRGKMALERGPLVYAAESIDNSENVLDYSLDPNAEFVTEFHVDLLNGITIIKGTAFYNNTKQPFTAIPYYSWANRGNSKMAVWLDVQK